MTRDAATVRQRTSLGSSGLRRAGTDGVQGRAKQGKHGLGEMVRGRWHLRPSLIVPASCEG